MNDHDETSWQDEQDAGSRVDNRCNWSANVVAPRKSGFDGMMLAIVIGGILGLVAEMLR